MKEVKLFPVLYSWGEEKPERHPTWPRYVPWGFIAKHEQQCFSNHSQTPKRLAERGGLSLQEMIAVVSDKGYREVPKWTNDEAAEWINSKVKEWAGEPDSFDDAEGIEE